MRPDQQLAMRAALDHGPGHCPPGLFAGSVNAIVRGLKAHANTIAHARHVAVEESYPRTRTLVGEEYFHRVAERHLADPSVLRAPPARIGQGFAARFDGAARDLATVEWAWLEAYGAPDAAPFDLAAIASLDATAVAAAMVGLHPAARLVAMRGPPPLQWEGTSIYATQVLVTRPRSDVVVSGADDSVAVLAEFLESPRPLADLLERDEAATTLLVTAGALTLTPEIVL